MVKRDQIVAVGDIVRAVGHLVRKDGTIKKGKPGIVIEVCQSGGMARVIYTTKNPTQGWVRTDCVEIVSEAG
tara:strand:- start:936 stop:1151 length:216 start_codon:yes stop_codon:yes gene_type:complete